MPLHFQDDHQSKQCDVTILIRIHAIKIMCIQCKGSQKSNSVSRQLCYNHAKSKGKKFTLIVCYGFHCLPGYQGFQHRSSVIMQQVNLILTTHTVLCQQHSVLENGTLVDFINYVFTCMLSISYGTWFICLLLCALSYVWCQFSTDFFFLLFF